LGSPSPPAPLPIQGEGRLALTPSPSPYQGEGRLTLTPGPSPYQGEGSTLPQHRDQKFVIGQAHPVGSRGCQPGAGSWIVPADAQRP